MGGVGDPTGQFADIVGARRRRGRRGDPTQQLGDRRGPLHNLAGGHRVAGLQGVADAQFHRVQADRRGEAVHLGLVAETRLDGAEAAHRPARRVVGVHDIGVHDDVGYVVRTDSEGGGVGADRRGTGRVRAAVEEDPCLDVDEAAVPGGAVLVAHGGRMPVHVAVEGLLAPVHHLHRAARAQGKQACMYLHRQVLARAERPAHPGERQPHQLRRQAEAGGDLTLVRVQPLGRDVEVDAAVLGRHRQPRLGAEKRLVLHAHGVLADDHHLRGGVRVALADGHVPQHVAALVQGGTLARHRDVGVDHRRQHVVLDDDAGRCPAGGLRVVGGDDRDRLSGVANLVDGEYRLVDDLQPVVLAARHVLVGEDGVHARHGERRPGVDEADARPGMR